VVLPSATHLASLNDSLATLSYCVAIVSPIRNQRVTLGTTADDSSISHPQVTIIELPPNTTAVYQPLDAGIIVLLKNRYKKRLLNRVVCILDSLLHSGGADPRVARGGGLDEGGQAHLRDAAKFIVEEWDENFGDQIVRCWLKADCLPAEAVARLRLQLRDIQVFFEPAHMDVSHFVAMMANTSLEHEFDGLSGQEHVLAVRRWLMTRRLIWS